MASTGLFFSFGAAGAVDAVTWVAAALAIILSRLIIFLTFSSDLPNRFWPVHLDGFLASGFSIARPIPSRLSSGI